MRAIDCISVKSAHRVLETLTIWHEVAPRNSKGEWDWANSTLVSNRGLTLYGRDEGFTSILKHSARNIAAQALSSQQNCLSHVKIDNLCSYCELSLIYILLSILPTFGSNNFVHFRARYSYRKLWAVNAYIYLCDHQAIGSFDPRLFARSQGVKSEKKKNLVIKCGLN